LGKNGSPVTMVLPEASMTRRAKDGDLATADGFGSYSNCRVVACRM
jgi:hypothetical protein